MLDLSELFNLPKKKDLFGLEPEQPKAPFDPSSLMGGLNVQTQQRSQPPQIPMMNLSPPALKPLDVPEPPDPLSTLSKVLDVKKKMLDLQQEMEMQKALSQGPGIGSTIAQIKSNIIGGQQNLVKPAQAAGGMSAAKITASAEQNKKKGGILGKALGALKETVVPAAKLAYKGIETFTDHAIKAPAGAAFETFGGTGGAAFNVARMAAIVGGVVLAPPTGGASLAVAAAGLGSGYALQGAKIGEKIASGQSFMDAERALIRAEEQAKPPGGSLLKGAIQFGTDPFWMLPVAGATRLSTRAAVLGAKEGLPAWQVFKETLPVALKADATKTAGLGAIQSGIRSKAREKFLAGLSDDAAAAARSAGAQKALELANNTVLRGDDLVRASVARVAEKTGRQDIVEHMKTLEGVAKPFSSYPASFKLAYHASDLLMPAEALDNMMTKATAMIFRIPSAMIGGGMNKFARFATPLRVASEPGAKTRGGEAQRMMDDLLNMRLGGAVNDPVVPLSMHNQDFTAIDNVAADVVAIRSLARRPIPIDKFKEMWAAGGGTRVPRKGFIDDIMMEVFDRQTGLYRTEMDPERLTQIAQNHGIKLDAKWAEELTSHGRFSNDSLFEAMQKPAAQASEDLRKRAFGAGLVEGRRETSADWGNTLMARFMGPAVNSRVGQMAATFHKYTWPSFRLAVVGRPTFVFDNIGEAGVGAISHGAGSVLANRMVPLDFQRWLHKGKLSQMGPNVEKLLGRLSDDEVNRWTFGAPWESIKAQPWGPREVIIDGKKVDPLIFKAPWPLGRTGNPLPMISKAGQFFLDKMGNNRASQLIAGLSRRSSMADMAQMFMDAGYHAEANIRRDTYWKLYMDQVGLRMADNAKDLPTSFRALDMMKDASGLPQGVRDKFLLTFLRDEPELWNKLGVEMIAHESNHDGLLTALRQANLPAEASEILEKSVGDRGAWGEAFMEAQRSVSRATAQAHPGAEDYLRNIDGLTEAARVGIHGEDGLFAALRKTASRPESQADDVLNVMRTFGPDVLDSLQDVALHTWDGLNGSVVARARQTSLSDANGLKIMDFGAELEKDIPIGNVTDKMYNGLDHILNNYKKLMVDMVGTPERPGPLQVVSGLGQDGKLVANDMANAMRGYVAAVEAARDIAREPVTLFQKLATMDDKKVPGLIKKIAAAPSDEAAGKLIDDFVSASAGDEMRTQITLGLRDTLMSVRKGNKFPINRDVYWERIWKPYVERGRQQAQMAFSAAMEHHESAVMRSQGWAFPIPRLPKLDESPIRFVNETLIDSMKTGSETVPGARTHRPGVIQEMQEFLRGHAESIDEFWPGGEAAAELMERGVAVPRIHLQMLIGDRHAGVLDEMADFVRAGGHGADIVAGGLVTEAPRDLLERAWVTAMWRETGFGRLHPELGSIEDYMRGADTLVQKAAKQVGAGEDPLLAEVRKLAAQEPRMSSVLLQRRFHIGAPRAERLMDEISGDALAIPMRNKEAEALYQRMVEDPKGIPSSMGPLWKRIAYQNRIEETPGMKPQDVMDELGRMQPFAEKQAAPYVDPKTMREPGEVFPSEEGMFLTNDVPVDTSGIKTRIAEIEAELSKPRIKGRKDLVVERAKLEAKLEIDDMRNSGIPIEEQIAEIEKHLSGMSGEMNTRTVPFRGQWKFRKDKFVPYDQLGVKKDVPQSQMQQWAGRDANRPKPIALTFGETTDELNAKAFVYKEFLDNYGIVPAEEMGKPVSEEFLVKRADLFGNEIPAFQTEAELQGYKATQGAVNLSPQDQVILDGGDITPQAKAILDKLAGGKPAPTTITNTLKRVLEENGIKVDQKMRLETAIAKLVKKKDAYDAVASRAAAGPAQAPAPLVRNEPVGKPGTIAEHFDKVKAEIPLNLRDMDAIMGKAGSAVEGTSAKELEQGMFGDIVKLAEDWNRLADEKPAQAAMVNTSTLMGKLWAARKSLPDSEVEILNRIVRNEAPVGARNVFEDAFIDFDVSTNLDEVMRAAMPFFLYEARAYPLLTNLASRYPAGVRQALIARADHDRPEMELPFMGLVMTPWPSPVLSRFYTLTNWNQKFGAPDDSGPLGIVQDFFNLSGSAGFYFHPGMTMALSSARGMVEATSVAQARQEKVGLADLAKGAADGLEGLAAAPYLRQFLEMPAMAVEAMGMKGVDILQDPFQERLINQYIALQGFEPAGPRDDSEKAAWDAAKAQARRQAVRDVTLRQATGVFKMRPEGWRDYIAFNEEMRQREAAGDIVPSRVKKQMMPNLDGLRQVNLPFKHNGVQAAYLKDTSASRVEMSAWEADALSNLNTLASQWAEGSVTWDQYRTAQSEYFKNRDGVKEAILKRYPMSFMDQKNYEKYGVEFGGDAPVKHPLDAMVEQWFGLMKEENPMYKDQMGRFDKTKRSLALSMFQGSLNEEQQSYLLEAQNDRFSPETAAGKLSRAYFDAQVKMAAIAEQLPKYLGYSPDQARQVDMDKSIYTKMIQGGESDAAKFFLRGKPWARDGAAMINPQWLQAVSSDPHLLMFDLVPGIQLSEMQEAEQEALMRGLPVRGLEEVITRRVMGKLS